MKYQKLIMAQFCSTRLLFLHDGPAVDVTWRVTLRRYEAHVKMR
jgi:hypothetical protein